MFSNNKLLFEFSTSIPTYGTLKKRKIPTLNNVQEWFRFFKSKLKNEYQDNLLSFAIPSCNIVPLDGCFIYFQIKRPNKRTLDADNIGFIVKWTIDAIKVSNWIKDDNKVSYYVGEAIEDKTLLETSLEIKVYERMNTHK